MTNNTPMFSLSIYDDNEVMVGHFLSIEGLEGESSCGDGEYQMELLDGSINEPFLGKCKIGYSYIKISIFDNAGALIVSLEGVASEIYINNDKNKPSVALTGEGLPVLLPGALPLLIERRKGFPDELGRWVTLDTKQREAWLEVSLLDRRKPLYKPKPIDIELDGNIVSDLVSFLCALGEKVFGPGGYIGRNLGALDDYLTCNTDLHVPFTIRWKNSRYSEEKFKSSREESVYKDILDLLKSRGVNVILD